jgi:4-carboxymuconolactone decarboxylase
MKYSPKYFENIRKSYPVVAEHFDGLAHEIAQAGPLSGREQLLVKLGIAIGIGSEGDVQNLTKQALADGMSPGELRQAALLTITTAGFPAMITAMEWIDEIIASKNLKRAP